MAISEPLDPSQDEQSARAVEQLRQTLLPFTYTSPSPSPSSTPSSTPSSSPAKRKAMTPPPSAMYVARAISRPPPYPSPGPPPAKKASSSLSSTSSRPSAAAGPVNRLTDSLGPDMLVLFVGTNPGLRTGETGHAYAHPSNRFWKLLHASGLTPRLHPPADARALPLLYRYGSTNVVERPTRDASMLSRAEMAAGVAALEAKVRRWRPQLVCLVGKGIWDAVERAWTARGRRVGAWAYGFRPDGERMGAGGGWEGARVFAATSTSGMAATLKWEEKLVIWKELGLWVARRRVEEAEEEEDEVLAGVEEEMQWTNKEAAWDEMKDEAKGELKDEAKGEAKDEAKDEARDDIEDEAEDEAMDVKVKVEGE